MDFDFLTPVENVVLAHNELLPEQAFGKNIIVHSESEGIPSLDGVSIVIVGVNETRNASIKTKDQLNLSTIRIELYKLFLGNWNTVIADLGDLQSGATVEDTYFALTRLTENLLAKKIIPIVIGGSQDLCYAVYRGFDKFNQMVNMVSVDSRFDFGMADELISSQSYMSKIIVDKPNNLFNFSNIGYQTYFNAQEEIDLMEKLFFDAYRLGEVIKDITIVEPVLRDADIISIDMASVKSSEVGSISYASPNGFDGREICAISRYAGISDKIAVFGIYECHNTSQFSQLVSQIIWYFIEGVNFRKKDYPFQKEEDYEKYIVPIEGEELYFYKSNLTGRWWMEIPQIKKTDNKLKRHALLPCTHQDYLDACNNVIPERWWKALKKMTF
ncbi:formimidoylglutamase [Abyssalbus ytuae]|uniref:Formimidoylglutamase n=1 Tax=Abyssalbus ytuae TaxID=2926907 RepID=A0A9E6ZMQ7_9FLAO|nr:formimidoylglutamase [Abyssalbus ytuae]UOB18692.1 formimidoylglutamase [Abyssalbus ytuae]